MRKSTKVVMSFLLVVAIMIPVAVLPASAATSYTDSIASVNQQDNGSTVGYDETQGKSTLYTASNDGSDLGIPRDFTTDGNNRVDAYVTQTSFFSVKLPKTIILNGTHGQTNSGSYEVEVEGNLASDEVVSCTPRFCI